MAKRVLVVGSTGMLGHCVLSHFLNSSRFEVYDVVYRTKRRPESIICDVTDTEAFRKAIYNISPNYIVNCVGILIKGSSFSASNAIKVNSFLPHFLSDLSSEMGFSLIHVSTDCVFSGNKGKYSESSYRDADDIYGRSKALGEVTVENSLTIRTSIIGPELKSSGEGLLHWFFTSQESKVEGFSEVYWGGVTTLELSKAIEFAVDNDVKGLWHLTNGQPISKYEMLVNLNNFLKVEKRKFIIPTSDRRADKTLVSERTDINYEVPSYQKMFRDMKNYLTENLVDYPHYKTLL